MAEAPLVSVVIPTYNRSGVIARTINDILNQTYSNLEIIVVDDGSTDDSQAVLKNFGNQIRVMTQNNAGPAAARNRGISASRGEIIAFQDSDDRWAPAKIERQVSLLQQAEESIPCCLTNTTLFFADGRVTSSFDNAPLDPALSEGIWMNVTEVLVTRFVMFNQAIAIRRKVLEKMGGFDETLKCLEDYDLALRLSFEGPWAFIREPLAIWSQGSAGSLSKKADMEQAWLKETEMKIRKRILDRIPDDNLGAKYKTLMQRELRRIRRELRATNLAESESSSRRVLGLALLRLEHYSSALFRRSPWYPKMETRPLRSRTLNNFETLSDASVGVS